MKYRINPAGNRIVDATPEETHALRPAIAAAFRRWRANEVDIPDFCQDVEIIAWRAIAEQRVPGDGFKRPADALLDFMFAVAWNLWRNHSRKPSTRYEALVDETPDMVGPDPHGQHDAKETLIRIAMRPDIARVLIDAITVPAAERCSDRPKSSYGYHLTQARKLARRIDAGHWIEPRQPTPPTPRHRKKKR